LRRKDSHRERYSQMRVKLKIKTCSNCGVAKLLTEFYAHPHMADGYLGKCKECKKLDVSVYRASNLDRIRAKQTQKARSEEGQARRRTQMRKACRKHRERYPQKHRARRALHDAIRRGHIRRQGCEMCGNSNAHAHHTDYSKPLDVRWLCPTHHYHAHGHCRDKC
jgi:ribosomal protein S27AE